MGITKGKEKVIQQWKSREIGSEIDILNLVDDHTDKLTADPDIVTTALTATSMLTVTFEPADDLTASPTDGHRTASNTTCADLFTEPICPELTAVFTPTAAPALIVTPALAVTLALTVTPELTTTPEPAVDVDKQELKSGKESPVVTSTGITSRMSTGITTVKTGIESSRLDACQRPPELVSVSASAPTAVSASVSAPASVFAGASVFVPTCDYIPAYAFASVSAPIFVSAPTFASAPVSMVNVRDGNDHRKDSLWDNHKENSCQDNIGRWHK